MITKMNTLTLEMNIIENIILCLKVLVKTLDNITKKFILCVKKIEFICKEFHTLSKLYLIVLLIILKNQVQEKIH